MPCCTEFLRYLLHMLESIFNIVRGELVFALLWFLWIDIGHTKTGPLQRSRLRCDMIVQHVDDVPALSIHSWCVIFVFRHQCFAWMSRGLDYMLNKFALSVSNVVCDVSNLFDDSFLVPLHFRRSYILCTGILDIHTVLSKSVVQRLFATIKKKREKKMNE